LPIAVGFGISTAEQVQEVAQFADAAVVGSAIVQAVENAASQGSAPQAVAELVKQLTAFSFQLSAGSVVAAVSPAPSRPRNLK
jgi:tryptophan synthase alpha subunit